ncbi:MAG: alkaline phosphatase family protein, partial [Actinomycetota bacterium]
TPAFIRYHTQAMLNMIEQEGYGRDGVADLVFTNYKQIDRVGHYFNMDSPYVRDSLEMTDAQLPIIFEGLDRIVGAGKWVVALTADHGQQPDDSAVDGFGISPREIEDDIRAEFGDVVRAVWPTEVFLYDDALEEEGVSVEEIARFLGRYTLSDNAQLGESFAGAGQFELNDRLFEMAIPAAMLPEIDCGAVGASP